MRVHKPVPPPQFQPPAEVPFVVHYAPHGPPDATGRVRCLGVRACDGGPMADLANAAAVIDLFQEKEIYVAPRWSSVNVPGSVTCEKCRETEAFLRDSLAFAGGGVEAVDAETAGVFSNPGLLLMPTTGDNLNGA